MPAMIARRQHIGNLLADGAKRAAKKIGKGAEKLVVESKGSEYPAYDPRGSIGMALAYATSDRGADHNRAWPVASDAYGSGDPWSTEGKAATCVEDQTRTSVKWSFIFCDFYAVNFSNMAKYYTAVTGVPADEQYLRKIGKRNWNLVKAFNVREGFSRKDDNLSERMEKDPLLSEYYKLWGWDDQGRPTKKTLEENGLGDIAKRVPGLK
jgi:aldehyde:ferredoxin oxidoreductase